MTLLQCYEKLHNFAVGNSDGHAYSQESIDINEIWKVILSSAEVSLTPLVGIAPLISLYGSDDRIHPSIVDAAKKFADGSISIKERFKSAKGLPRRMTRT